MPFFSKMEPICLPFGPQKSTKTPKVPPKVALSSPSGKLFKFHRFLDPPEPSESSWRLHKTSIVTFSPYPQNRLQSTSQNLLFGHLWASKPPKVRKMNAPENTLKNTFAKISKKCQNDLPNTFLFWPGNALFYLFRFGALPKGDSDLPNTHFFIKKNPIF